MSNILNRDILEQALRDELIGPSPQGETIDCSQPLRFESWQASYGPWRQADNGEEILQRDRPTKRYGIGVLYPLQTEDDPIELEADSGVAPPKDETDVITAEAVLELERIEERIARDRGSPTELEGYDLDLSGSNTYRPSSLGISFLTEFPDDALLEIFVRGGRYSERDVTIGGVPSGPLASTTANTTGYQQSSSDNISSGEVSELNHEIQFSWWLRSVVCPAPVPFTREELVGGVQSRVLNLGENFVFSIEVYARSRDDGQYLITVSLVNRNETDGPADSRCLFQTFLSASIRSESAEGLICPYPSRPFEQLDPEEQSFELLDRHQQTFAIGHGCAGDWEASENSNRASQVFGNCLPRHELPSFTPNIQRSDGSGPLEVAMAPLAGIVPDDDGMDALEEVVSSYEVWIERQRARMPTLPDFLRPTAHRHLESCRSCANRMRSGLGFLRGNENSNVRLAFQLANRAILLQQLMTHQREPRAMEYNTARCSISFSEPYAEIDILEQLEGKGNWRAFQIAFFLMSLESTVNKQSHDRERVELIWFPTGGGKTEAYSALAAFSMLYRRLTDPNDVGVDVLMRYTLRLLTAQQFQRATALICAMEKIRRDDEFLPCLGEGEFTIGIWVGRDNTPNQRTDAVQELGQMERGGSRENRFLVTKCPCCRAQLGPIDYPRNRRPKNAPAQRGYARDGNTIKIHCSDDNCEFSDKLPVVIIDEDIYEFRPTMVIGTVDKFATLAWRPEARSLFGIGDEGQRTHSPPTLIIQDELHLISGPLGSMAGLYEAVVEELATDRRVEPPVKPKIVCSTATICHYQDQVRSLYGRIDQNNESNVTLFPPPGIDSGDSFFAEFDRDDNGNLSPGRRYLGVHGVGLGSLQTTQVRTFSALLQAVTQFDGVERDPWWTLLSFFNSLRELGTSLSLLQSDIPNYLKTIRQRQGIPPEQWRYLRSLKELTGRLRDDEVPRAISELEVQVITNRSRAVDVCLASNIIEVGIDIDRLSLMTVVGQPKTTSQYIQVTGRVGRKPRDRPGLVVTIYSASKPRDRSHFEKFRSYHSRLNAQVEPTSVTPFSPPALDRALHAVMVAYVRQIGGIESVRRPSPFPSELIEQLRVILRARVSDIDQNELANFDQVFHRRADEWRRWERQRWSVFGTGGADAPMLHIAGSYVQREWERISWPTPTSLRNVDAECQAEVTTLYLDDNASLPENENA